MHGIQLFSTITGEGKLLLSLERVDVRPPDSDEIVVRMDAAPINPSDIGLLLGAADIATLSRISDTALTARYPEAMLARMRARLDKPMPVGNEGAGLVVDAGADAKHLIGKNVAIWGGAMYAQYRTLKATEVMVLPDHVTAEQGAAAFINPLTVLGMIETARSEGHRAMVHTAAASNLGHMLNRACSKKGIELVNIVRSDANVQLMKAAGARYVLNSSAEDYPEQLVAILRETEARLAFDAIGGPMPGSLLTAMEHAMVETDDSYNHYGSAQPKKIYVYGVLDRSPIILPRTMGSAWSVEGWLLFQFLEKLGSKVVDRLKEEVSNELTDTFASHYDRHISLYDMLDPEVVRGFYSRATGQKYLLHPQMVDNHLE